MADECKNLRLSNSNDPISVFFNMIFMLFCYPVYTIISSTSLIGIIMIFAGSTKDKNDKTSYNTSISISGIIITILDILAIAYIIYEYYIAKHK